MSPEHTMASVSTSPRPAAPTQRIVVGVDGSAQSELALRWAAWIAAASDATIEAVAAWRYPITIGWAMPDWDPKAYAEKTLRTAVAAAYGDAKPSHLKSWVREGSPAEVLLHASDGALMLILGSRGMGGFKGLLLGSVSAHCAEHANCPVLIVHEQTPRNPEPAAAVEPAPARR